MQYFNLTLRTFLIILAVIITLQHARFVPLETILIIFSISVVATITNMIIFKLLGLMEEWHEQLRRSKRGNKYFNQRQ